MIYFIEIIGELPIKIGYTSKPVNQRLSHLQVASPKPMRVLAVIDGGKDTEAVLHEMFQDDLIRGEWYHRSNELLDFLEGCGNFQEECLL